MSSSVMMWGLNWHATNFWLSAKPDAPDAGAGGSMTLGSSTSTGAGAKGKALLVPKSKAAPVPMASASAASRIHSASDAGDGHSV